MRPHLVLISSCLSLAALLAIAIAHQATVRDISSSGENVTIELAKESLDVDTLNRYEEKEEDSSVEDQNEDNEASEESNRFNWKHHLEDHAIYAHRSLMSSSKIERFNDYKANNNNPMSKYNDDEYESLKKVDFVEKEWQLMFRSLDLVYDSVSSSILQQIGKHTNLFDEVISRLKPNCRRDINHIRESVKKHKLWALRMLDSNGKVPSGVTYGRFSSPGDYEECLSVKVEEKVYKGFSGSSSASVLPSPELHKFNGKYCLIDFRLPLPERPKDKLLSIHDPVLDLSNTELVKQFPQLQNYSGYASVFYEVGYMHALCLPTTCEVTDLTNSLNQALEGIHIIVNNTVDCEVRHDEPQPLRKSQVISIILLIVLFSNAICASVFHYIKSSKQYSENLDKTKECAKDNIKIGEDNRNLRSIFLSRVARSSFYPECFSIQTNLSRLTKPDPRGLTFVHYTRIVAMALTVITHTAGLGTLQAITKPTDTSNSEQIFRDLIPQMLANAFTSIQIFFFMAGFMLVISTYPSIQREKGHLSFVEYALKRAIRLMPGIAATICLNFLWPLFVDGPMLSYFVRLIVVPCESNWWRTLGFLSNFDHVEKMCLRHSYFSASDYQLHLMAFPLLILLYKQPAFSLFIAGILTVTGFAAQVIMILTKTVLPFMMVDYIDKEAFFNVVHYIHHPVWNHMSAFFYGFIIGYLVIKQIRINLKETTIKRLWLIILPAGIVAIFAPYFWNHYKRPIYRWQMVLYVLFDRFILLTTCAWLSYATMVLARKPAVKKPSKAHLNLPDIVSLEQKKELDKHSITINQPQVETTLDQGNSIKVALPQTFETSIIDSSRLTCTTGVGIPRQRSSPNFLFSRQSEIRADDGSQTVIRPAISSANVNSTHQDIAETRKTAQEIPSPSAPEANNPQSPSNQNEPKKKKQAPISNVNTLCLVLSRLTFQLYLFNMVVLWVDVNNSKYFWFFSYYFIITKAAAIYICSSLLAMVFFITLESPCLTLYIMWVKSRAQTRATKSREGAAEAAKQKELERIHLESLSAKSQNEGKVSPGSSKRSDYEGLCMKMSGNSSGLDKPTLSVVDLSQSSSMNQNSALDQTKM